MKIKKGEKPDDPDIEYNEKFDNSWLIEKYKKNSSYTAKQAYEEWTERNKHTDMVKWQKEFDKIREENNRIIDRDHKRWLKREAKKEKEKARRRAMGLPEVDPNRRLTA